MMFNRTGRDVNHVRRSPEQQPYYFTTQVQIRFYTAKGGDTVPGIEGHLGKEVASPFFCRRHLAAFERRQSRTQARRVPLQRCRRWSNYVGPWLPSIPVAQVELDQFSCLSACAELNLQLSISKRRDGVDRGSHFELTAVTGSLDRDREYACGHANSAMIDLGARILQRRPSAGYMGLGSFEE